MTNSDKLYTKMKTAASKGNLKEADRLYPLYCEAFRKERGNPSLASQNRMIDRESSKKSVKGY